MGLPGNSAAFAYAWSLAVVEVDHRGRRRERYQPVAGPHCDIAFDRSAVHEALHSNYADLEQQALEYLKHEYVR